MSRRRTAGFSMLESTIALAIVGLVASTFLWSGPETARGTAAAFRASAAHRLAGGVLERAGDGPLSEGQTTLAVPEDSPIAGAELVRTVREREPGLYEVEALVRWQEPGETAPRSSRLVTMIAREVPR